MKSGNHDQHVAGAQRPQRGTAPSFPCRDQAHQRDGNAGGIEPGPCRPGNAAPGPERGHASQHGGRQGAIPTPAEPRDGLQHDHVATQDDQVAQRRAAHAGHMAARGGDDATHRQGDIARRADAQEAATCALCLAFPYRHACTGNQRDDDEQIDREQGVRHRRASVSWSALRDTAQNRENLSLTLSGQVCHAA
jgi:hypothetical protein